MPESTRGRRALLIAISQYRNPAWNLDGPSNDLAVMYRALTEQFGFGRDDIEILRDEEATRDGILAGFDRLIDRTRDDDIVVVFYAGHGSQMTCREGDEADGMDETLVPHDSGREGLEDGSSDNKDITDDELHEILQRIGARTSYTTLIFDCCHAGTITRDPFATKLRSIESDERDPDELPPSPIQTDAVTRSTRNAGPAGFLTLSDKYVLIAGCADGERSAEKRVGRDHFGALTWYLTREIAQATPGTTYRDVFERITGRVTADRAEQHPQMEGMIDRELFGVQDIVPMRYLRVVKAQGDEVTIGGGAAHGLTVGSRWAIVPPGTSTVTDDTPRLAEIEITSVGPIESEGRIVEGTGQGSVEAGARAIETRHAYGDLQLRLEIVVPPGREKAAEALRGEMAQFPILAEADAEAGHPADVRVYLMDPAAGPDGAGGAVPGVTADGPSWVAVGEGGEIVAPVKPYDGVEAGLLAPEGQAFVDNLETLARYRQVTALSNPDPDSWLAGAVTFELLRVLPDGSTAPAEPEEAGGIPVFEEGEEFELLIRNDDTAEVHLNLLLLDPACGVNVLWPEQAGSNEGLAPGVQLKRRSRRGPPRAARLTAALPERFPFSGVEIGDGPVEGVETYKLFVTTEPADFGFLRQAGVRAAGPISSDPDSPLGQLMRRVAGRTRSAWSDAPADESDWAVIERTIRVRRKSTRALDPEGGAVDLGSMAIQTPGLAGEAEVHPWRSARARSLHMVDDRLTAALGATGLETRSTIEISNARASGSARTRGIEGRDGPTIEVDLASPGTDFGQMLLATNEAGLLTWHFPEAGAATRGTETATRGAPAGRQRFVLPASVEENASEPKRRGLVGAIGKKLIQQFVFPLVDPAIGIVGDYFAGKFEEKKRPYRLRTFAPDDFRSAEAEAIDGESWARLASGRSLLLVHGSFGRAHTGFGAIPREFLEALHREYEGRVFAFDHHTLSKGPRENVEWLLQALPDGIDLELDLLCHARGGLVGRVLAERQGDLDAGSRRVRIGKIVFAGSPNAGTALADAAHLSKLLDRYTNVLNVFDFLPIETGVVEVLEGIITVAKQLTLGTMKGLDGIQAMVPGGAFARWLDEGRATEGTRYFALASDFRSQEPSVAELVRGTAAKQVFGGVGNDLIVPTAGVYDRRRAEVPLPTGVSERRGTGTGGVFPIGDREVFEGAGPAHFDYFADATARARIMEWLARGAQ